MSVFIKNYYSSVQQYNALQLQFFDEGPIVYNREVGINSSSIDTREIDQFRHGVEITQEKHTLGMFKVSAGTPGHIVRPQAYGIAKLDIVSPNSYTEIDNFDSLDYINSQAPGIVTSFTYPTVITSDNNQLENIVFNGIIEPLSIRKVLSFFSVEFPYESHAFRGSMMAGNIEQFGLSSDQVLSVDYVPKKLEKVFPYNNYRKAYVNNKFYLDAFKIVVSGSNYSGSIDSHNTDYLNDGENYIEPFVDKNQFDYLNDLGITIQKHGEDMYNVFKIMTGSTDNYIPPSKKSATVGFVYDNIGYAGTDSIAFGGLTY